MIEIVEINIQNIQKLTQFNNNNNNKNTQPNMKISRRPKQKFIQRRHIADQKTHENMFSIINYKEMKIRTTMRYYLTPVRVAII